MVCESVLRPDLQRKLDERLLDLLRRIRSGEQIAFVADEATRILADYEHRPGTRIEQFGETRVCPNARDRFKKCGKLAWALFADPHSSNSNWSEGREALYEVFVALATFAWRASTKVTMKNLESRLSHYLELRQLTEVADEWVPPAKATVMHELGGIEAKILRMRLKTRFKSWRGV